MKMKYLLLLAAASAAAPLSLGFAPSPIGNINTPHTALQSLPNSLDTLTSGLASIARIKHGVSVTSGIASDGPASKFLPSIKKLFDIENSRECRLVRERITELDLCVDQVIPACPNSNVVLEASSGSIKVPMMIVESSNGEESTLEGSDVILQYLEAEFKVKDITDESQGEEDVAGELLSKVDDALVFVPGILRAGRGSTVCGAASSSLGVPRPQKPLVLYNYETNQFCRLVREVLTELDIVYELRSAGKGSPRREELASITGGSSQCPFLIDPNTGIKMAESKDIIEYLYKTYAAFIPPSELLKSVSGVVTLLKPVYKAIAPLQAGSSRENEFEYKSELAEAKAKIFDEICDAKAPVVIYTYSLSPFCTEATALLDSAGVSYKEVSLGKEWIPGLIDDPLKRAALLEITGSSSLPNIFVGGNSIGGLFSGTPGLLAALESGELKPMVETAMKSM